MCASGSAKVVYALAKSFHGHGGAAGTRSMWRGESGLMHCPISIQITPSPLWAGAKIMA